MPGSGGWRARKVLVLAALAMGVGAASCGGLKLNQGPLGESNDAGDGSDGTPAHGDEPDQPPARGDACPDRCEIPITSRCSDPMVGDCQQTPSWTPVAIGPRLVLWLDAGRGIAVKPGEAVDRWADLSGRSNDAVQPIPTDRPLLGVSSINGRPTLTFLGTTTFLSIADSPTMQWGTSDFAMFVVARSANDPTTQNIMLYQKVEAESPWPGAAFFLNSNTTGVSTRLCFEVSNDGNWVVTDNEGYNDNVGRLYAGRRSGTTLEVRVDGVSRRLVANIKTIDVSTAGRDAMIGQNGYRPFDGFQALKGDISEMIAIQGSLSDVEVENVEKYLISKYALGR